MNDDEIMQSAEAVRLAEIRLERECEQNRQERFHVWMCLIRGVLAPQFGHAFYLALMTVVFMFFIGIMVK
jgi:hypothetical protein